MLRVGLIINPVAGIGGPAGLKGSDGAGTVASARARGAASRAEVRAERCLASLATTQDRLVWLTVSGAMGEAVLRRADVDPRCVMAPTEANTTAADTRRAAEALVEVGVEVLVFVGGDGTARDVLDAVGVRVPVLGIPAGVKMHSGVFAVSPEAAAELLRALARGAPVGLASREVRDIDEAALRDGRVRAEYYGELLTPGETRYLQHVKVGGVESEALVADEIAESLLEQVTPDTLLIVGPGTTVAAVAERLGVDNTLLGFDAVRNGCCLGRDLDADGLRAILSEHDGPVRLLLGVTGGQGFLLGRGNQQLRPDIVRRIGREAIRVLAAKSKLTALGGRPLYVDTDDPALDRALSGLWPIHTGYEETVLYRVSASADTER